jgi:hypothetical protein
MRRDEMVKLCAEKAVALVDVINAVKDCRVYRVLKVESLYENVGGIRLDITYTPCDESKER